jgi:hypothetical protein
LAVSECLLTILIARANVWQHLFSAILMAVEGIKTVRPKASHVFSFSVKP